MRNVGLARFAELPLVRVRSDVNSFFDAGRFTHKDIIARFKDLI